MSDRRQDQSSSTPPAPSAAEAAPPSGAVQGEGDYEAARRYRKEVDEFLAHADVEKVAQRAAPKSALEARELALAEDRARRRSKGDEPTDVGAMYPGRGPNDKP